MDGDNIRALEERARELRNMYRPVNFGITINRVDIDTPKEQHEIGVKELMKQRHLHKYERDALHKPNPDWKETPVGEVLYNSSSLVVEDIISKYNV